MTKYKVVLEALSTRIDGMRAGDPLPSESELAREFDVSPMTVRRALQILSDAGRITGVRGRGTFVTQAPVTRGMQLTSFSQMMQTLGRRATARVLSLAMEPADDATAAVLGVEAGEHVYRIRRVRMGDGTPIVIDDTRLLAEPLPGLLGHDFSGSLYAILRDRYGISITTATTHIGAVVPEQEALSLLELPAGAPCLRVRALGRHDGEVIEHTTSLYRADMYEVAIDLAEAPVEVAQ